MSNAATASFMGTRNWSKSWGGTISVRVAPGGGFKRCCLKTRRYDGVLRDDYFQGMKGYPKRLS